MSIRSQWRFRDGVVAGILVLSAVGATWQIWVDIWHIGTRSEENSYILLAPAVVIWLAWLRRDRLPYVSPQHSVLGPVAILLGWWLARFGQQWEYDIFYHFGGLLIVCGAGYSVLGWQVTKAWAPAFLALLFLLPTPGIVRQQIALPLQTVSAQATEYLLDLFGVAAIREGNVLKINGYEVAIAEACNGMRMVSSLALVTFAFVFSTPMRNSLRVLFFVVSPLIALLVNILRLLPTVLAYGYASTSFADTFHALSGWLMLLLALSLLWVLLSLLRWLEIPLSPYVAAEDY